MNKKGILIIIAVMAILIFLCRICSSENSVSTSSIKKEYEVIHSTGLYSSANANANQIDILEVGTKLIPANNGYSLDCETFSDSGINFNMCKVKVLGTNQTGWILRQWIK